ncbi:hypothetical protein [Streptomyces sp. enrichment culture]|uniref:hypothetical protein n=1 Tax=Streptomyces sp. enrichment culture TaxID=1795815 RepID=UPI003F54D6C2
MEPAAPAEPGTPAEPPADGAAPVVARPRRRWGRTVLLIAAAAVIGVSAGTAVGYKIQADRPPTPLPPLNQPGLAYPAKPLPKGQEPPPLTAAEDRRVKTDGDLRKLLVPTPKGLDAKENLAGLPAYALRFKSAARMFENLAEEEFRRVATKTWKEGHRSTYVRLVQFQPGYTDAAAGHAADQRSYMPLKDHAGNEGVRLKGSAEGRYYVYGEPQRKPGYLPLYQARAIFHRGDIMADIWIYDSKPISANHVRTLAERQLERL